MSRRLAVVICTALAILTLVVARIRSSSDTIPRTGVETRGDLTESLESSPPGAPLDQATDEGRGLHKALLDDSTNERKAVLGVWLSGKVTDTTGSPIVGASLLIVPDTWRRGDDFRVFSETLGTYSFPRPDGAPGVPQGALIVEHPGYEPWVADLPSASEDASGEQVDPRLVPCDPTIVVVHDAGGQRCPGSKILIRRQPATSRAHRTYERDLVTDSEGEAVAYLFPDSNRIEASDSSGRRAVWYGPRTNRVELTLGFDFTVEARFAGDLPPDARLEHLLELEGGERFLVEGWPAAETPIPLSLPCMAQTSSHAFTLQGAGLVPVERVIPSPTPGSHHVLTFELESGNEAYFRVFDELGAPVAGASVLLQWQSGGGWSSLELLTDEGGLAQTDRAPEGSLWATASKAGYATRTAGPYTYPAARAAWPITLLPSGTIRGRCTSNGEPVSDFRILYWPRANREAFETKTFEGRADGSFELDDVPQGLLGIAAENESKLPEESLTIQLGPEPVFIELKLEDPGRARGRIVDLESGMPIAGVDVQAHLTGSRYGMLPWGDPAKSDTEGEFALEGLSREPTAVTFSHVDYSGSLVLARGTPGIVTDLGSIALSRDAAVTLQLHSEEDVDFTRYSARGVNNFFPEQAFDETGLVEFRRVRPGRHMIHIQHPDGSLMTLTVNHLPGLDTFEEVSLDSASSICVATKGDFDSPPHSVNIVQQRVDGGLLSWSKRLDGNLEVCFTGLPLGAVGITALDVEENVVGTTSGHLVGNLHERFVVHPSGRSLHLLVTDRSGQPLPGIYAYISSVENPVEFDSGTTDPNGRVSLSALPDGDLHAWLSDMSRGEDLLVPIPSFSGSREQRIVFEVDGKVDLTLVDGSTPVPFATVRIQHPAVVQSEVKPSSSSSEAGGVSFENLSPGSYLVSITSPFSWPTKSLVTTNSPNVIQVRSLGNLTVRTPLGLAGRLQLDSIEMNADVSTWIDEGAVTCTEPSLRTQGEAPLEIVGLPRGEYAWTFSSTNGRRVSGRVEVPPRATGRLEIILE